MAGIFRTLPLRGHAEWLRRRKLLSVHVPQREQHKLTDTVGEAERRRGAIYSDERPRGAQVRLRTRATFQRVKGGI